MAADYTLLASEYDIIDLSANFSFSGISTNIDTVEIAADYIDLSVSSGSGPGGSERPTTGMLYPRRKC